MAKGKSVREKRGVLVCLSENSPSEMVKLRRDATIFGREKADIIIDDPEVSATHCQIQCIDDAYHIFDMNSSNGTFLNNERIVKAKLKEGDTLVIGRTRFRFALEDEKNVRHIPTLFGAIRQQDRSNSLVDTLIEKELRHAQKVHLEIQVQYGDGLKETLQLYQSLVFIGRASSFGHFDQDTEISRKHMLIKLNDSGEVFIEDQGSTNGCFLNGQKITGMHRISSTDEIRVGRCLLRIKART